VAAAVVRPPRRAAGGGPFVAGQLLAMPEPLRLGLAAAPGSPLFTDVTGLHADQAADGCDTCPAIRLPLLMLAPIAVAYEAAMSGNEAARSTWRADRYSPCPRPDAGRYLAFLASIGYHLSVIERAVADGVPYTGDVPAEPIHGDLSAVAGVSLADDDPPGEDTAAKSGDGQKQRRRDQPGRRRSRRKRRHRPERGDGLNGGTVRGGLTGALTALHAGAAGHHGRRPPFSFPDLIPKADAVRAAAAST